jgi:hypothetical protein
VAPLVQQAIEWGEYVLHLGPRFALPEFHAVALDSGSLPMPVLEDKIRRWTSGEGEPTSP